MKIGKVIKVLRKRKRVTQKELSKKAGISQSYLSLLEKDKREPDFEIIRKISSSLKISEQLLILLASYEKIPDKKKFHKHLKNVISSLNDILKDISF